MRSIALSKAKLLQPSGEGLEQDLRQALRPGDVQKGMCLAVGVAKPSVQRHIPPELCGVRDAQRGEALAQRTLERALAADEQAPLVTAATQ